MFLTKIRCPKSNYESMRSSTSIGNPAFTRPANGGGSGIAFPLRAHRSCRGAGYRPPPLHRPNFGVTIDSGKPEVRHQRRCYKVRKREVNRHSAITEVLPQDYIEALIDLRECVRRITRLVDLKERKPRQTRQAGARVRSNDRPREKGPLSEPKLNV